MSRLAKKSPCARCGTRRGLVTYCTYTPSIRVCRACEAAIHAMLPPARKKELARLRPPTPAMTAADLELAEVLGFRPGRRWDR